MRRPSMQFLPAAGAAVARHIAERLGAQGERAWIVGGALRDLALGLSPADIDMASAVPPERLCELFERTVEVGKAFGTVVVHHAGLDVQVTTFRTESAYTDQRRPDRVEWGHSVEEDASRRDFTCNALYLDPLSDELVDPQGGLPDIEARRLVCVGEPERRFREDGLRLVRLARLAAALDFEIDPAALAAARSERAALRGVSSERVAGELRRMLERPRAQRALALFDELGLYDICFPSFAALAGCRELRWSVLGRLEPAPGFAEGLSVLFASEPGLVAGAGDAPGSARESLYSLRLSRDETRSVEELWRLMGETRAVLSASPPARARRVRLVRHPLWPRAARLLAAWFAHGAGPLAALEELRAWACRLTPQELAPPALLASGDLASAGLPRGPLWGQVLDELELLQLEGSLDSRESASAWLTERVRQLASND